MQRSVGNISFSSNSFFVFCGDGVAGQNPGFPEGVEFGSPRAGEKVILQGGGESWGFGDFFFRGILGVGSGRGRESKEVDVFRKGRRSLSWVRETDELGAGRARKGAVLEAAGESADARFACGVPAGEDARDDVVFFVVGLQAYWALWHLHLHFQLPTGMDFVCLGFWSLGFWGVDFGGRYNDSCWMLTRGTVRRKWTHRNFHVDSSITQGP